MSRGATAEAGENVTPISDAQQEQADGVIHIEAVRESIRELESSKHTL